MRITDAQAQFGKWTDPDDHGRGRTATTARHGYHRRIPRGLDPADRGCRSKSYSVEAHHVPKGVSYASRNDRPRKNGREHGSQAH
jgi:hypothetical protein